MMELENQVLSFELAKKFKELEVIQDSYFYWIPEIKKSFMGFIITTSSKDHQLAHPRSLPASEGRKQIYSAFTVAELGELFSPFNFPTTRKDVGGRWKAKIYTRARKSPIKIEETTEANARGKILIYLIENKLLMGDPF